MPCYSHTSEFFLSAHRTYDLPCHAASINAVLSVYPIQRLVCKKIIYTENAPNKWQNNKIYSLEGIKS